MKRSLMLPLLLAATIFAAACGGGDEGANQAERTVPSEPRTQEASAPESVTEENTQDETVQEEAPSENGATEDEPADTPEQEDPSGLSVTTIEGEEVGIGQGEATALFFMAGW